MQFGRTNLASCSHSVVVRRPENCGHLTMNVLTFIVRCRHRACDTTRWMCRSPVARRRDRFHRRRRSPSHCGALYKTSEARTGHASAQVQGAYNVKDQNTSREAASREANALEVDIQPTQAFKQNETISEHMLRTTRYDELAF
jgi:hypothetical protein